MYQMYIHSIVTGIKNDWSHSNLLLYVRFWQYCVCALCGCKRLVKKVINRLVGLINLLNYCVYTTYTVKKVGGFPAPAGIQ